MVAARALSALLQVYNTRYRVLLEPRCMELFVQTLGNKSNPAAGRAILRILHRGALQDLDFAKGLKAVSVSARCIGAVVGWTNATASLTKPLKATLQQLVREKGSDTELAEHLLSIIGRSASTAL